MSYDPYSRPPQNRTVSVGFVLMILAAIAASLGFLALAHQHQRVQLEAARQQALIAEATQAVAATRAREAAALGNPEARPAATSEIQRLRDENAALKRQIEELQKRIEQAPLNPGASPRVDAPAA